jgi:hypothetical protein
MIISFALYAHKCRIYGHLAAVWAAKALTTALQIDPGITNRQSLGER